MSSPKGSLLTTWNKFFKKVIHQTKPENVHYPVWTIKKQQQLQSQKLLNTIHALNVVQKDIQYSTSSLSLTGDAITARKTVKNLEIIQPDKAKTVEHHVLPFWKMPGPRGLPVIGTLLDYIKKGGYGFHGLMQAQFDRSVQYGPIYREKLGPEEFVVITDPKEYSKVVRADPKYPARMVLDPMVEYRKQRNLPIGLFNALGEEWYKYRSVLNHKMMDIKECNNYLPKVEMVSHDFIVRLGLKKDESNFCIETELFHWAMESIGTLLFDARLQCLKDPVPLKTSQFVRSVAGYTKTLQTLMTDFPWYKYYDTKLWKEHLGYADTIFDIGQDLVEERLNDYKTNKNDDKNDDSSYSILRHLMQNTDWSNKEINITLIDLMMAAIETTCFAVLWTMYCLAKTPRAQKILLDEILQVAPKNTTLDMDLLHKLTYLKCCVKESMRLFPVVYTMSRKIHKDLTINNFLVPKQSHVQGSMYAMGRNEQLFDQPFMYLPERWLSENVQKDSSLPTTKQYFEMKSSNGCPFSNVTSQDSSTSSNYFHPNQDSITVKKMLKETAAFGSLPWGHGARMCIGRRISEIEVYSVLFNLVRGYDIKLAANDTSKVPEAAEDVKPILHLVLCPSHKIKFNFTKRSITNTHLNE